MKYMKTWLREVLLNVKVKYMGREILLESVPMEKISSLNPRYDGTQNPFTNIITIESDSKYSFANLMHEFTELHIALSGVEYVKSFDKEVMCDIVGRVINQLIFENGVDVIAKLWEFSGAGKN